MVTLTHRRASLAGQLLAFQLLLIGVVLVAVAAVSLAQSATTFERVEGRRVTALAEQIAANPLVRENLAQPATRTGLATYAQSIVTQVGVSSVSFAEADLDVRVSTDPSLEARPMPLGSERVRAGASWSGVIELGGETHLASQVPVIGDHDFGSTTGSAGSTGDSAGGSAGDSAGGSTGDSTGGSSSVESGGLGTHLGTVFVTERVPSTWERLQGASSYLLTYLGIALVVGTLGSWLLSRRIKRQTRGMEPQEIASLADHREAMLRGIAEGVIALDPQHRVTLVNDVARHLLDLPEHCIGVSIDDLRIEGRLREVLIAVPGADSRDEVVIRRGRVLVMNTMRVAKDTRLLGTVTTLRDRTELADLEREIGAFRSTAHVLRAQAHEFANQLHTISGLIQIGAHDDVVGYVEALSEDRSSLDLRVSALVHEPTIAALLMAKVAAARERRVDLTLSEETALERLEPADAADVATVLGNLVDNALEHAPQGTASHPWVRIRIRQDASTVEVHVTDSGPGIPPELAQNLFEPGVTTKSVDPLAHGVGLALTRLVCRRRGGEIQLERVDGVTTFVAQLGVSATSTSAPTVEADR